MSTPAAPRWRRGRSDVAAVTLLALVTVAGCSGSLLPATPTPAPVPTPTPTPAVASGRALITFGTKINETTLAVTDPTTTFKRAVTDIAWSLVLDGPAGATTLTVVFASRSSAGTEKVLDSYDVTLSDPSFDVLANDADLAGIAGHKAGTYVLRYLRDTTVIGEGVFRLT